MTAFGDRGPVPLGNIYELIASQARFGPVDVDAGLLSAYAAWLDGGGSGSGNQPLRALLYDDDSRALVAISDEVVIPDGLPVQIVTFPFSGGTHWKGGRLLAGLWSGPPSGSARVVALGGAATGLLTGMPYEVAPPNAGLGGAVSPRPYGFVTTSGVAVTPDLSDEELAAYGWNTAQLMLAGSVESGSQRATSVEWHHTSLEGHEGSFALVRAGGPLEELVGDVVRVTFGNESVYVYVIDAEDDLDADLSLARRAFMQLANLASDEKQMTLEVVGGAEAR